LHQIRAITNATPAPNSLVRLPRPDHLGAPSGKGFTMRRFCLLTALLLLAALPARAQLFDSHVHLHRGEASLKEYEAQVAADKLPVTGFGAMWFGGPNQALAGQTDRIRAGNDQQIALAAKNPKLLPIATVHPYDGDAALTELQRVAAQGVKVLKIHPHTQKFDAADPRVLALAKRAGDLGVIVMMDNAGIVPGDCEKLFNLALAAPKTTFLFAHLGGMNFRFWNIMLALRTAKGLAQGNMYFDISAIAVMVADSPIEDEFVWTIRNVGADHVLLGSDYPQYSLARNVRALERLGLTEQEKAAIRYGNARRLFKLN
jgi:predicted TIM-barrel fold metal-dependent hydrolase